VRLPVLDTKKLSDASSPPLEDADDELVSPLVDDEEPVLPLVLLLVLLLVPPLVGVDEELGSSLVASLVDVDEELVLPDVAPPVPVVVPVPPSSALAPPQADVASERPRPTTARR
jgi:hypothetical protein